MYLWSTACQAELKRIQEVEGVLMKSLLPNGSETYRGFGRCASVCETATILSTTPIGQVPNGLDCRQMSTAVISPEGSAPTQGASRRVIRSAGAGLRPAPTG